MLSNRSRCELAIVGHDLRGFLVGQTGDALLRLEVEFHVEAFAFGIDEAEGVRAEAMLLAQVGRNAAVAHQDGDLVQRFGAERPEIPGRRGAAQVGLGIALLGVDEVGELERVADEEHRGVVADQVPVAFVGVELDGEAAHIALGVGGAAFAGHGRKTQEQRSLLADLGEDAGAGVLGDVVGDGEGAVGARALGVHHAFGDAFTVEMGELFYQPEVLQQRRAARTGGQGVGVVGHRGARGGGQMLLVGHGHTPYVIPGMRGAGAAQRDRIPPGTLPAGGYLRHIIGVNVCSVKLIDL